MATLKNSDRKESEQRRRRARMTMQVDEYFLWMGGELLAVRGYTAPQRQGGGMLSLYPFRLTSFSPAAFFSRPMMQAALFP